MYFDVKNLIHEQIKFLSTDLRVQKFIRHNKQLENNELIVSNWQQELKIFEEANLNRPIYKDLYTRKDSASQDLSYIIWTAKTANLQVRYITLGYKKDVLRTFEATLQIKNILYKSEKRLRLSFQPNGVLQGYGIKGNFDLIYGAHHDYEIDAVIKGLK